MSELFIMHNFLHFSVIPFIFAPKKEFKGKKSWIKKADCDFARSITNRTFTRK
jgi:hypothetical protein